jgi:hypothetical protein
MTGATDSSGNCVGVKLGIRDCEPYCMLIRRTERLHTMEIGDRINPVSLSFPPPLSFPSKCPSNVLWSPSSIPNLTPVRPSSSIPNPKSDPCADPPLSSLTPAQTHRYAGLRCPSQLLRLKWCNVNLPESWMTIHATKMSLDESRSNLVEWSP